MANDGSDLEQLVTYVETMYAGKADVKTNRKIYDEDGNQIAEFDIEIRGKFASTDIAWLIECRDRPSDGAAPGAWIQQLRGRRDQFHFNKVTAVSTTGFSPSALAAARDLKIELREVKSLSPENFPWIQIQSVTVKEGLMRLESCRIAIDRKESKQRQAALKRAMRNQSDPVRFMSIGQTKLLSPSEIFAFYCDVNKVFDGILPNTRKGVTFRVTCSANDIRVPTDRGNVRIAEIELKGTVELREAEIPRVDSVEYGTIGEQPVAQDARFVGQSERAAYAMDWIKLPDGNGQVVVRVDKLPQNGQ